MGWLDAINRKRARTAAARAAAARKGGVVKSKKRIVPTVVKAGKVRPRAPKAKSTKKVKRRSRIAGSTTGASVSFTKAQREAIYAAGIHDNADISRNEKKRMAIEFIALQSLEKRRQAKENWDIPREGWKNV